MYIDHTELINRLEARGAGTKASRSEEEDEHEDEDDGDHEDDDEVEDDMMIDDGR
jgi:hypothetical protein